MDKRQRQMMLILPLIFVFIIIGLPAGVIVYWITTNALMFAQQYGVKKMIGPMTPLPSVDGAAAGSKDGAETKPAARKTPSPAGRDEKAAPAGADGNGAGGVLAGLFRGRAKDQEQQAVAAGARSRPPTQGRSGPPPRSPRKKKKRSGRRR
jgi:YidC/Oxa1 family membrane protein insertase